MYDGTDQQPLFPDHPVYGTGQRHHGPGNGRGAGSPVRLQHVAVQRNRPLAQRVQVHRLAKAPADQPLDFHAPAVLFDPVPFFPFRGGCRQHRVFRRHPSLSLPLQERRNRFLNAGCADHPGVPRGDQAAAVRRPYKIRFNRDRPFFLRPSSVPAFKNLTHTVPSVMQKRIYASLRRMYNPVSRIAPERG